MKMEIHKLQMTQYAISDTGGDTRSQLSLGSNKYSVSEEIIQKSSIKPHGFMLPKQNHQHTNRTFDDSSMNGSKYTKKSLMSAGRNSIESVNAMNISGSIEKSERKKQKQKILSKLEEL